MDSYKEKRAAITAKVTWTGVAVNCVLSAGKIIAGVIGRSGAMIADGIHSISDFITDFIILFFLKLSAKEHDIDHRYGHGKFETFSTFLVSVILLAVGVMLAEGGIEKIVFWAKGGELERPGLIAAIAAVVSIIAKEWLFRYTYRKGKEIGNDAVIANAWHHRSDALSSIGVLVGILGAIFLGERWAILDPVACVAVSVFIFIAAIKILIPAVNELVDHCLPGNEEKLITDTILEVDGVRGMHHLRTRKSGNLRIMDVHIKVDPNITVDAGHDIATAVEKALDDAFDHIPIMKSIHIEPYRGKDVTND